MESSQVYLVILGLVLLVGVQQGSCIKCWQCKSGDKYEGDICADKAQLKGKIDLLVDCEDIHAEKVNRTGNADLPKYTLCRSFTQNVEGDWRITRQCASDGRTDRCIERAGTKGIKLNYCHCEADGCNTAASIFVSAVGLVGGVAVVLMSMAART